MLWYRDRECLGDCCLNSWTSGFGFTALSATANDPNVAQRVSFLIRDSMVEA